MKTKRTSFLARTAMTLLFTVLTTVTTWADSWPSYITNVVLVGGTESEAQSAKSGYSGYTWCSQRLNEGKNADIIYIGYKTSSSADTNGDYITDISDVSNFIDYLLGNYEGPVNTANLDLNYDGEVDISDLAVLIDFLLNGYF